jgi:hypothetical protein
MAISSTKPGKAFYADQHSATADVKTLLRDYTGELAPGEFCLVGSSGIYSSRTESAAPDEGTIIELAPRSLCNMVVLTIEDPFGTKMLYAADSLQKAISGSVRGAIAPRVPRYTSAEESQKVIYNPGPDSVQVTMSWEEMGKGGFLAGGHPGNGVLTLELGEIDPAAEGFPLFFRVRPGRKFRIDGDVRLYTTQVPGGGALTLEKADGTVLTATPEELDLLPEAELHHMHLVDGATSRTVPADGWLDIVITSAGSGAPGNLTVEFDYTLL